MVNGCGNVTADGRLAFGDFFGDDQIVHKGLGVIGKIQRKRNPDPKPKMKNQARERGLEVQCYDNDNKPPSSSH